MLKKLLAVACWLLVPMSLFAANGNRLAYLDGPLDPYYPHRDFPKLITPQWVGEEGVECVVTLAIDDMRESAKYEAFLRPILDRLKKIDGRAPVSIMSCRVDPADPQLQAWLKEGLSIEVHTYDHPCPCLQDGGLAKAKETYDKCVDLMNEIPGNKPVAFRMPCCDSKNTPSPRFWAEAFNKTTAKGNFLQIDSSVFNVITSKDKDLPKEITQLPDGSERFRRYIPFPNFVNTIEDYPYPYVIGGMCWEFPCVVPSDWSAQHVQKPNNPDTVRDWKLALDACVIKQGTFNLVFHPHGWIKAEQIVELIDHAVAKHGKKVKFLTFKECAERLTQNALGGIPLSHLSESDLSKIDKSLVKTDLPRYARQIARPTLVDVNADGYMDVRYDLNLMQLRGRDWDFDQRQWKEIQVTTSDHSSLANLAIEEGIIFSQWHVDIDGDGNAEAINRSDHPSIHSRTENGRILRFDFPNDLRPQRLDPALKLIDINADGKLDCVYSDEERYALYLFNDLQSGWATKVFDVVRGQDDPGGFPAVPPFVRADGTNNGAFFHSGALWFQNEDTWRLPDHVLKISFEELLAPLSRRAHAAIAGVDAGAKPAMIPVGAARIDITPDYPVRLSGYGNRNKPSEGVAQRIYARAIAIGGDDGDGPAIVVNAENCGVTQEMIEEVAARLKEKAKLPRERLVVCSTHTHSAPWLVGAAPYLFTPIPAEERAAVERYTRELTDKLVQVALDALAARKPATLAWGQGKVGFAANRRVLQSGKWTGFGVTPMAPVDHSLPILAARDADGKLLAVLVNYACHCTTMGGDFNQIAGDWAGFAQEYMEADNPGAIATVIIGCGADANPEPRGGFDQTKVHGRSIADEVKRLLATKLKPLDSPPKCQITHVELPFAPLPSKEEWQKRAEQKGVPGYHAQQFLARLEKGEKIDQPVKYPIAAWTFGDDLAMVFLGGEVVVDYAIRLKTIYDDERLWVTSYASAMPGYIASKRILDEGGYEADSSMLYYGQPGRWANEVEEIIIAATQKLMPAEFVAKENSDAKKADDKKIEMPPPKSPDEALKSMHLRPGMKIELVAAEPLVVDPVAFDWGPDGRLWVVEMRDYPNGITWRKPGDEFGVPGGRVKVLTDENGDGKYDKAKIFLDELPFPTGVKVWRGGILVTAAPDIFYAEDTTGDDVADKRILLYRGFGEGNQQHRVNGLRWGLDNWLYVGNGDSGGVIKAMGSLNVSRSETPRMEVNVNGRDLRIRPDTGELDAQSGQTQFGRERDDWGNWFGGNNSNPMWHYPLEDHYLRRNPNLTPPPGRKQVSVSPGAAPVFPRSKTLARFNDFNMANRFTSACSPIIYRDTLLGEEIYGNGFVCEPVHNLVAREIVTPDGVTFTSRRAPDEQASEFLASDDNWFRPSMCRTGPDGALWVSDMYRFVVEHPKWIPEEFQQQLDLRAGDDKGRIYRIYPEGKQPRPIMRLDKLDTAGLVAALDSPNGIQRDLVQQMLIWRDEKAAAQPLAQLGYDAERPQTRLQALCTLDGLDALKPEHLALPLNDKHPAVVRHAVRLAEPWLAKVDYITDGVLSNIYHDDPLVRMQVAYSLGTWNNERAAIGLGRLLLDAQDDPYLKAAALSSLTRENVGRVLTTVLANDGKSPPVELVEQLFAMAAAFGDKQAMDAAVAAAITPRERRFAPWQLAAYAGLVDLCQRQNRELPQPKDDAQRRNLAKLFEQARQTAETSTDDDLRERIAAVRLLGRGPEKVDDDIKLLGSLLAPQNPGTIQSAVISALVSLRRDDTPAILLAGWSAHTPPLRGQILDALLSRDEWSQALLSAVEEGRIAASQLDARRRQQLLTAKNDTLRSRAEKVLAGAVNPDRQKLVEQYLKVASDASADATRGKAVFAKRCANCHRLEGAGHSLGPDLVALTDRSPQALVTAVLDPNRAVEDKFLEYVALLVDGRQVNGILLEETGASLTLAAPEGKQTVIPRSDVEQLKSSGKSLMPEGVERDITPAEMADLVAYLRGSTPPPKQLAGNKPEVVRPFVDGSIRLLATNARVYGPTVILEEKYRNLGWWNSLEDHAVWTFEVPQPGGQYRVTIDYACDDSVAGNTVVAQSNGQSLATKVDGTGSWDNYRGKDLGVITLPAGPGEILIRSDGPIRGALLDLRSVRLVPVK